MREEEYINSDDFDRLIEMASNPLTNLKEMILQLQTITECAILTLREINDNADVD